MTCSKSYDLLTYFLVGHVQNLVELHTACLQCLVDTQKLVLRSLVWQSVDSRNHLVIKANSCVLDHLTSMSCNVLLVLSVGLLMWSPALSLGATWPSCQCSLHCFVQLMCHFQLFYLHLVRCAVWHYGRSILPLVWQI